MKENEDNNTQFKLSYKENEELCRTGIAILRMVTINETVQNFAKALSYKIDSKCGFSYTGDIAHIYVSKDDYSKAIKVIKDKEFMNQFVVFYSIETHNETYCGIDKILKEEKNMKYAVISYYIGKTGNEELWLCDKEDAKETLNRLWEQSYNFALNDEDFDEKNSYHEEEFAVLAWKGKIYRYFKVVKQNKEEVIKADEESGLNKILDEMIAVVEDWKNTTDVISCETIIKMLKANKK